MFAFLSGIQKTVSTRQKLDAQLNENKIVLEVIVFCTIMLNFDEINLQGE
jgi:hypothetical protein